MNHSRRSSSYPALTRRRFLEQLGAVGGSSLVFSTLTSWDLMAASAGQRPELTGKPAKSKVVVLGAGLSGMVVGYELGKLGYDFQILEARDRVGGLQWAVKKGSEHTEVGGEKQVCTFDEGQYVNVGPWRIPYSHTAVLNYCRELNVPVQVFLNDSESNYFYYEGNAAGALSNRKIRVREVKADMAGAINELLVKAIDQKKLDLPLTAEDQNRLTRYLITQGYLDTNTRSYKAFENRGRRSLQAGRPAAGPIRAADALGTGHGRHHGGAHVPADRRHGPDFKGLPARHRSQAPHLQRRDPVGAPG